jgi:hypothetical protein
MNRVLSIIQKESYGINDIVTLLKLKEPDEIEILRSAAESLLVKLRGTDVYFRGVDRVFKHLLK